MIKILLVRHGETEWNKVGKMQGWGDSPLSELGRNQAQWLNERLKEIKIDKIYSSPTGRAYETSQIIRGNRDIEIIKHNDLREINVGKWEGLDKCIVESDYKEQNYNFWNEPHKYKATHGGEDFFEVRERVCNFINNIIEDKNNEDKTILLVSHAITIKSFLCKLEGYEIEDFWREPLIGQTSLTEIDFSNDGYNMIIKGDISHYK